MSLEQRQNNTGSQSHAVSENAAVFRGLVAESTKAFILGKHERAALAAQQASTFAWFNHPGIFADSQLESVLWKLGSVLPYSATPVAKPGHERRVVLHVATQIYPTGGHTQMLVRWIHDDPSSEHRIATLRQGSTPVPAKVTDQLSEAPLALDRRVGSIMGRALLLRQQAEAADFVIVHAHPDDIVSAVALAGLSTPSIYINHADHVFWAGSSVPNCVAHLRSSGRELSRTRRDVSGSRSLLMNRPLAVAGNNEEREPQREQLGLSPEHVLLVTAASANKFEPIGELSWLQLLEECVQRLPNLVVRAAGPADAGEWRLAAGRTGGRIRALGTLSDVQPLFAAADIYVDSFPFSSLTSLLEAGSHGLPVVSFRGHDPQCAVLGADSPTVDAFISYPDTPEAFFSEVSELVNRPRLRSLRGDKIRNAISSSHASSWKGQLEELYRQAPLGRPGHPKSIETSSLSGPLDQAVLMLQDRTGYALGALGAQRPLLGVQRTIPRLRTWFILRHAGFKPRGAELASDRWRIRIELGAARLRRLVRRLG